jgi:thioredoxin 2
MEKTQLVIRCLKCGRKNRLDPARSNDRPICGICRSPLDDLIIQCFFCGARNRILEERIEERPICGKCRLPLYRSAPRLIRDANFEEEVVSFPGTVLLGCLPGKDEEDSVAIMLSYFSSKYAGGTKIAKLFISDNPNLSDQFTLREDPVLIIFCNGKPVGRFPAGTSREIIEAKLISVMKTCSDI